MMITLSQYDLDELYEIRDALNKEIEDKEDKLRDQAFEQEEMQLEDEREEYKGLG
jgi:FtsZ-binding cell division protein ZapB